MMKRIRKSATPVRGDRRRTPWAAAAAFVARGALAAGAVIAGSAGAPGAGEARADEARVDPVFGFWLVENERAIIEIGACRDNPRRACGWIAWLAEPLDESGRLKRDVNNPDAALRARPLCGVPLITALEREDEGEWEDGSIYDASRGSEFSVRIRSDGRNAISVRGYAGLSLFGRTQTWTRQADARGGCPEDPTRPAASAGTE